MGFQFSDSGGDANGVLRVRELGLEMLGGEIMDSGALHVEVGERAEEKQGEARALGNQHLESDTISLGAVVVQL